jgi:hypothetical protein
MQWMEIECVLLHIHNVYLDFEMRRTTDATAVRSSIMRFHPYPVQAPSHAITAFYTGSL